MGLFGWFGSDRASDKPRRKFVFNAVDKKQLTPKEYGFHCVTWSLASATTCVNSLIEQSCVTHEESLLSRLKAQPQVAHLQFMATVVASYYVYVATILQVSHDVLDEVFEGIEDGLATLQGDNGVSLHDQTRLWLSASIRRYVQLLHQEIVGEPLVGTKARIDSGSTGTAVAQVLENYYNAQREGVDSVSGFSGLDYMLLQQLVGISTMGTLTLLKDDLDIMFSP